MGAPTYSIGVDPSSLPTWDSYGYLPAAGTYFTVGTAANGFEDNFIGRVYYVQKILLPLSQTPINIPLLLQVWTRDSVDQNWDKIWAFDPNPGEGTRQFSTAQVYATGDQTFVVPRVLCMCSCPSWVITQPSRSRRAAWMGLSSPSSLGMGACPWNQP